MACAVRRRRPAGLRRLPERRAAHPAPLRLSRLLAPLSSATCRRCCWAAGILVRLLRRLRLLPTTCGACWRCRRTGRFHRLRLRRRLHAVGPAGRAADRTPGPAATAGAGRRRSGLGAAARRAALPCCSSPPSGARPQLCLNLLVLLLSRARPRNAGGPEHLRHLPGRQPGTASPARWPPCRLRHAGPVDQRRRRGRRAGIALAPERARARSRRTEARASA